ncbi:hypothetical protein JZO71_01540 [Enterococcus sp. MSG2901]|uniref:Uncharacterized protein n=1 Tax=Candidatus Enterococcus courvalinii TaxID=2815329 RepID=A0ABS3HY61_9ENTE|nr:hypothetical protein [Enterococcus sp. MSG2901]
MYYYTYSNDQNWLDSFNSWAGHTCLMNQEGKQEHLDYTEANIHCFNNEMACGPAIELMDEAE